MNGQGMRAVLAAMAALLLAGLAGCTSDRPPSTLTQTTTVAVRPTINQTPRPVDFPTRDITVIVPSSPGGWTDLVGRQFALGLGMVAGVNVNVENVGGGAGSIGTAQGLGSAADGYTLVYSSTSILAFQPVSNPDLPFGEPGSYTPIAGLGYQATGLFVRADSPFQTFEEFMAYAKEHPKELRLPGDFSVPDVAGRALAAASGTEFSRLGMPQAPPAGWALGSLLAGTSDALFGHVTATAPAVMEGAVRCLGLFDTTPSPLLPSCPLILAYADPKISLPSAMYVIAPPGVPENITDRLIELTKRLAEAPTWQQFMKDQGFQLAPRFGADIMPEIMAAQDVFEHLPGEE